MTSSFLIENILNPPVLYFFLGMFAVAVRSDLEIPAAITKFLTYYILIAIGFRGGAELAQGALTFEGIITLLAAVGMALTVPIIAFYLLRHSFNTSDSAALAACFGSVSAVTFTVAVAFLENLQIPYGGHMIAAMAIMEAPAILIGIALYRYYSQHLSRNHFSFKKIMHEGFFNGSVLILLGSILIGFFSYQNHHALLEPFYIALFPGMLAFFLLDLGLTVGRQMKGVRFVGRPLVLYSIAIPLLSALLGFLVTLLIGMSTANAFLFIVLSASASYIAVPAALRSAIPTANPALYVTAPLAITFPFNVAIGLPLYYYLAHFVGAGGG